MRIFVALACIVWALPLTGADNIVSMATGIEGVPGGFAIQQFSLRGLATGH